MMDSALNTRFDTERKTYDGFSIKYLVLTLAIYVHFCIFFSHITRISWYFCIFFSHITRLSWYFCIFFSHITRISWYFVFSFHILRDYLGIFVFSFHILREYLGIFVFSFHILRDYLGIFDTGRRQTIQKYNTENHKYEQYGPHQTPGRAQASAMGN